MNAEPRRRRVSLQTFPGAATQHDAASLAAHEVREIVRDELRRMFGRVLGADDRTYSTRAGCSPDGYSRDAWRDLARRIGRRRGRYWVVTSQELDTHERGERDPKQSNDRSATSTWSPAVAARSLGLRPAGGAR